MNCQHIQQEDEGHAVRETNASAASHFGSSPKTIVGIMSVMLSMLTCLSAACQGQATDKKDVPQIPVDCPFAPPPPAAKPVPLDPISNPLRRGTGVVLNEVAIDRALDWLAKHQMPDGSWQADHGKCNGNCRNPGTLDAPLGATALSLMAFIGNGNSIRRGKYQSNVTAGFQYIIKNMKVTAGEGDCTDKDGKMYSHGLCTIALCEEYHITRDESLRKPAQLALDFLQSKQDPESGGWSNAPRTRGDMNLFGIQMLAITSGQSAGLQIKPEVFERARRFLDSVQKDDGAAYGLHGSEDNPQTNAIGLLCRAFLGWDLSNAAFKKGLERLSANGISRSNLCYNYFVSHLLYRNRYANLHHWHRDLHEMPIPLQTTEGHEAGSWYFPGDPANDAGGRLYCTAMTCLTLEMYYCHLPLWQHQLLQLWKQVK